MGANRACGFQGSQQRQERVVRAVGTGLLLGLCAVALSVASAPAGTGPGGLSTRSVSSTTKLDAAASNAAMGFGSPLWSQAASEQQQDPAGAPNTSNVNEVPDTISSWWDDMKKRVDINPVDTINVTVCVSECVLVGCCFLLLI